MLKEPELPDGKELVNFIEGWLKKKQHEGKKEQEDFEIKFLNYYFYSYGTLKSTTSQKDFKKTLNIQAFRFKSFVLNLKKKPPETNLKYIEKLNLEGLAEVAEKQYSKYYKEFQDATKNSSIKYFQINKMRDLMLRWKEASLTTQTALNLPPTPNV